MYPVIVMDEGARIPSEGTCYLVGRRGLYMRKHTGLIEATIQVEQASILQEVATSAKMHIPKLPAGLLVRALRFFRRAYKLHHSEAAVLLHYAPATEQFMLVCPDQHVTLASVSYDCSDRVEDYYLVGSIHSHCDFGAFHSGVDVGDEEFFDGLHITIGNVNQPYCTLASTIAVNNNRFPQNPSEVIDGVVEVDWEANPANANRRRKVPRTDNDIAGPQLSFGVNGSRGSSTLATGVHQNHFWNIALPEGKDFRHFGFPTKWMDRVHVPAYPREGLLPTEDDLRAIRRVG